MQHRFDWKTYASKLNTIEALLARRRDPLRAKFLEQTIPNGGVGAELGVYKGQFTRCILDVVAPERLHLIDPWYLLGEKWEWAYGNQSTIDALVGVLRTYAGELVCGRAVLHIGDDLEVLLTFPDSYFDWVYLDTSHDYGHSVKELELLSVKVKAGGVIAGDDWQADPAHAHHGLCRAAREFVAREPYDLIYANDTDKQWAIRRRNERSAEAAGIRIAQSESG